MMGDVWWVMVMIAGGWVTDPIPYGISPLPYAFGLTIDRSVARRKHVPGTGVGGVLIKNEWDWEAKRSCSATGNIGETQMSFHYREIAVPRGVIIGH